MQQIPARFSSFARPPLFAFDLDGTVTTCEILPCLAAHLGLAEEITELTRLTLRGEIDFTRSFQRRVAMLRALPLDVARKSIAAIPLDPHIEAFINSRPDDCAIVTGNLDLWVHPLRKRLACRWFTSQGALVNGELRLLSVLDKGLAVEELSRAGRPVVAVGESANDVPMFAKASLGIAFAGVHEPAPALQKMAHCTAYDGAGLRRLLDACAGNPTCTSIASAFSD